MRLGELAAIYGVTLPAHLNPDEYLPQDSDQVNHPKHYSSHGSGIEVIEITRLMSFDIGNAVKYILRSEHKGNTEQDLRKALWYLNDAALNASEIAPSRNVNQPLMNFINWENANRELPEELLNVLVCICSGEIVAAYEKLDIYLLTTFAP